ncbi:relaxase/mobilization nuclease domain-containing protein [Aliivibrio finisterrensis]|uniref:Type IV secretion system protein VirD2 n=1 Tax=Aliivibrio finisterrensis TaxID=511998 RepID=A0A4V1Z7W5_9GAMM|nr:relaxase/mobilization nuclease domain-containing protein [Aliivibrio finisterrensis]RYU46803.1 type IV secretion system protein VirD2 [Aliivibrio finisterrensis]RYU47469.1 type IV secretion system protein VirD2 [Aliivibrio finisterrensis]RYU52023.1 type IV secretion system protein VirD2 [Aliivibrio finisterrensis]RYU78315.1 type IV secretion system protein VirD2 [Aliivibrio finisterrensis]
MIYKEPDQKGGKHSSATAETLVEYIAGNDERIAKNLIQYANGDTKAAGAITEFICASNITNIPEGARSAPGEQLDMSAAIKEMQSSIALNTNVKQQFKHMIVSLDTDESLNNSQWRKTVRKLMKHLGYDNCRYIVFKHNDTDEQHVHIVTSTIDTITRKRVRDSYSKVRAQEVMRELEKEFGLRELVSSKDIGYDVKAEINDASIFNKKAQIARLVKQGINKLAKDSNLAEFVIAVESTHPDLKVEIQKKNGTATGLVFNLNDVRMSASQLGGNRKYTLGKLIGSGILDKACRCLDNHEEELERAAEHAQKQLLDAVAAADDKRDEDNATTLIKLSVSARHAKEVNNLISDMRLAMRARRAIRGASDVAYVVEVRSALSDFGGSIGNIAEALIEHLLYQFLENKEKAYAESIQKTYNSTIVEEISETEYKNFTANAYTEILNKDNKNKKDKVYNAFGSVIGKELYIHNS